MDSRPVPKPLDPPMVPFAIGGIVLWAVAALVVLPFRDQHGSWLPICIAGVLWGLPGLATMIVHDRNRRRRLIRSRLGQPDGHTLSP